MSESKEILPEINRLTLNELSIITSEFTDEKSYVIRKLVSELRGAEYEPLAVKYHKALEAAEKEIEILNNKLKNV